MGRLELHEFDSQVLERTRQIRVWIHDDYDSDPPREFPVLWQHDGQMAFTERDEILPFGSWGIDEWIDRLAAEHAIRPPVTIAIDNSAKRTREYDPLTEEYEQYSQFLLQELLPWARGKWRLSAAPADNALMGSSMGGLVSFGLAKDHPEVWAACACLSPWFEVNHSAYVRDVLLRLQQKPPIRVYFDTGILDWRGLDDGHRATRRARNELLRLGFVEGEDFDFYVETTLPAEADLAGSPVKEAKRTEQITNQHTEFVWRRRLKRPLEFLFGTS